MSHSPVWRTRIDVDLSDDGDTHFHETPSPLLGQIESMTPFERSEFFYECEAMWCWDCGEELADCTCADEDDGVVP